MPQALLNAVPRCPRTEPKQPHRHKADNQPEQFLPKPRQHFTAVMDPTKIVPQRPKFLIRADVQPVKRLCNADIRDTGDFDVLFREDAAKRGIMGIIAGAITDKKHIGYPCVDYLRLLGTIYSVNKSIDNALLVDFISLTHFISLLKNPPICFMMYIDDYGNLLASL